MAVGIASHFSNCDTIKGYEPLVQFLVSYATFSQFQNASFWCKPHYKLDIWLHRYAGFDNAKTKEFEPLFLPKSQKQHLRHPTHSSWSCHIMTLATCFFSSKFSFCCKWWNLCLQLKRHIPSHYLKQSYSCLFLV